MANIGKGFYMAVKQQTFTKEERIQQLKDACDSIKEKAADFVGNEEFNCNMKVSIVMECREFPYIRLERDSLPSVLIRKMQ